MKVEMLARKKILSALNASAEAEKAPEDLVVQEGETIVVSTRNNMVRHYREIKPKSADEVKAILGVPDPAAPTRAAESAKPSLRAGVAAPMKAVTARGVMAIPGGRLIATDRLVAGKDVDEAERLENSRIAREATHAFVYGNAAEVAAYKPLIERYLELRRPIIVVPFFRDVTVHNGGTLTIAQNTLALFANRIRLYGTGRIVCSGPKTIHCTSFEGFL